MKYALRADENQAEIVKTCRSLGASVSSLHRCGKGIPDLLVGYKNINFLFEVKDGKKNNSQKKLTLDQKDWHEKWQGKAYIVESASDVLNILLKNEG